ncbi:DUF1643 domain-containing protein [Lactiplantibacillus plantarum]|uniref:DUF1643 domain-containing protein n=1 Tax=Lactiplantibacillus plantarum TaxID=1590 RepID=UPI0021A28C05|nr:DUF1643 domain-containing protein [Lactiplantibacillus plantarum]MCT3248883.1 DUF1643 domain-containing protein [Lactiplantibacillus plantarum]
MTVAKLEPTAFKLVGEVKFNKTRSHRYELKITWKQPAKKIAMVITNYPGHSDGIVMDLTTMLVVNRVSSLGYDGVVMVNLFSKLGLKANPKGLIEGADSVTDQVILLEANEVAQIIIATGSFPKLNVMAKKRQAQIISSIKKAGFEKKLALLCDSSGKLAHPLAAKVRKQWILTEKDMAIDK